MDQYSSADEEDVSLTMDDPEQMAEILHEYFDSDESSPYNLTLLRRRKDAAVKLDPIARQHFGITFVPSIPSNPESFEELKRRQVSTRARRWFHDDFTTYPEYAISNTYEPNDDVFFSFDLKRTNSNHNTNIVVENCNETSETETSYEFFDAFDNDFKDILLVGEMSDLSITVTNTLTTHLSHGIGSYQRLRDDAERKWQLFSVPEKDEEKGQFASPLPNQIRRNRRAASFSTASSLTSGSNDSSTEYYEARARYYDEDIRFDKNGMMAGYHHPVNHVETPMNKYTISALLARAKAMLVDQQSKHIQDEDDKNMALETANYLIHQLQKDSSLPHSMAGSSVSDEFSPPAVVACDVSTYSSLSEVSNSSSRKGALTRKDVRELLTKLEEESQKRRARLALH